MSMGKTVVPSCCQSIKCADEHGQNCCTIMLSKPQLCSPSSNLQKQSMKCEVAHTAQGEVCEVCPAHIKSIKKHYNDLTDKNCSPPNEQRIHKVIVLFFGQSYSYIAPATLHYQGHYQYAPVRRQFINPVNARLI